MLICVHVFINAHICNPSIYIYIHIYFIIVLLSMSTKGFWNANFRLIFKLLKV